MAVEYTHEFELEFDGIKVEGDAEFNLDGVASFHTNDPLPNLTVAQAKLITHFFQELRRMFLAFGDIKKIRVEVVE